MLLHLRVREREKERERRNTTGHILTRFPDEKQSSEF